MRFLTGTILLLSAVLCLVLGGLTLASASYKKLDAQTKAGDLSAVSEDLVDDAQLEKMRQEALAATGNAGAKQLVLGGVLLVCALLQLPAGVLIFLQRARSYSLVVIGVSSLALVASMALDTATVWAGVCLALLLIAAAGLGLRPNPA